jgi:hypothetical protein
MKRFTFSILLLGVFLSSFSEVPVLPGNNFGARFLEANTLMDEKLWSQSIENWLKLLEEDPNNANINYKIGYCYLQTANSKREALQYLEAASVKKYRNNYDANDASEKRAPVQALYYLGRAQALNLKLDDAISSFEKLQKELGPKHLMYADASRQLEMAREAKLQMASPKNYIITNVGPVINKQTNDYSPVLSLDESTMFFTSRRLRADTSNSKVIDIDTGEWKEDVYQSFKSEEGLWTEPEILNLNTDAHDATISVSPDGQMLFIYRDNYGDGTILSSQLVGETWSEPILLGSDINTQYWETHATISADGNTLFFVSDRPGGIGARDIYKCVKLPNGEWSRALNLGPVVNTIYAEDAPFLTPDGRTLYFASQGHKNMGGFDIFFSKLGEDGEWSAPEAMGYPLNTVDDDVFFVPMGDGRRAYYSSEKDGGYGLKDIYLVDMPDITNESNLAVLKGFIIAADGEELPEDLRILVTNSKSGEVTEYRPRMRDGGYLAILAPCTNYHVEYFKGKEMIKDDDINVPCGSSFQEIEREVYILPVITENKPEVKPKLKPEEKEEEVVAPVDVPKAGNNEIKDFKYDPNDPINTQFIEALAFAQFSRYFVYDFTDFGKEETEYTKFIGDVKKIINLGKKPVITIESSASRVPSSRFKTNEELTSWRNKTAEDQIKEALLKIGLTEGKDYTFGTPVKLVQGKKYENDAQKSRLIYEQFQYIKIKAQG